MKRKFPLDQIPTIIEYSPRGDYLIVSTNNCITLLSYPQYEFVSKLGNYWEWHEDLIKAIAVSNDGSLIASIDQSERIKIWDTDSKKFVKEFATTQSGDTRTIEFDSSLNFLVIGGQGFKGTEIWNINSEELLYKYDCVNACTDDLKIDDNNNILVASGGFQIKLLEGQYEPSGVQNHDIENPEEVLYPNPTNDVVNIDFTLSNSTFVNVELLNLGGQVLDIITNDYFPSGLNNIQYNSSYLSNGAYYIKISYDEFIKVYKLVKEG